MPVEGPVTLEQMGSALRDLETLREPGAAGEAAAAARTRLVGVQEDAATRRTKLERQLAMADEFLALLGGELSADARTTEAADQAATRQPCAMSTNRE